jgi:hypothetical protein
MTFEKLKKDDVFTLTTGDTFIVTNVYHTSVRCKLLGGNTSIVKNYDDTYTVQFYKHKIRKEKDEKD